MKRFLLLLLIALSIPFTAFAVAGQAVRFDWSLGSPTITADATSDCNDTATARFDWVLGEPTIVYDATANCTTVTPPSTSAVDGIIWFSM